MLFIACSFYSIQLAVPPAWHRWDREVWKRCSLKAFAMCCCSYLLKSCFSNKQHPLDYQQAKPVTYFISSSHMRGHWVAALPVAAWTCSLNGQQLQTSYTNPSYYLWKMLSLLTSPKEAVWDEKIQGSVVLQCSAPCQKHLLKDASYLVQLHLVLHGWCFSGCRRRNSSNCCMWTPCVIRGAW